LSIPILVDEGFEVGRVDLRCGPGVATSVGSASSEPEAGKDDETLRATIAA
jgi:hypothetical protein